MLKNSLLICFSFLFALSLIAQIEHVEPLNWYVGFKNQNLQLLINGKNIGETTPEINYAGVTIKRINKAESKNYLFIDLLIASNAKPGNFIISFKKNNRILEKYTYTLLPRENGSALRQGFSQSDVIYLIVPDRFANGDTTNDVVAGMKENKINRKFEGGRHGGDLRGIINNLDYIKDMGYTAIWPTPMLENNMQKYSYHGYSITNHYKVDPRFGSLEEYKELAVKAKQKGIKLIFDEVLNHTGLGYWWMDDLPFKNWIHLQDSFVRSNHKRTVNQDLYASEYDKDLFTNAWFDVTMPDMDAKNTYMARYLIQNTKWWIETLQLGGVRQDTYGYSDKDFLTQWSCEIMNEYPNFNLVGEEWSLNPSINAYWQKGNINKDGYKSCLPSIMDFPMQAALVDALNFKEANIYEDGMNKLYEALANDFIYPNPNNMLLMVDNHDMNRIYTQLNQDLAYTKIAITHLLTTRGIPQIFYGTEILMDNTGHNKNDGIIRTDFTGGWANDSANAFTQKGLKANQIDMQNFMKQLLNWRKNNEVIAFGKTMHFVPLKGVYTYFRYSKNKMVMVVMNKSLNQVMMDTKSFKEILKNKSKAVDIFNKNNYNLNANIPINTKSAMVFEIE